MAIQIQIRRDLAATWTSDNPKLAQGEIGYETDTGKLKIGDGVTAWTGLSYFSGTALVSSVSNSDGTLTISPTTGAVIASLALGKANTWTAITTTAGLASGATLKSSGSPYTVLSTDEVIIVTTGAGGYTVDLPAASTNAGRKLIIIKADSGAGAITVTPAGADTIEGSATKSLTSQYNKIGLISDGSSIWYDLGTGGGI